jgi:hypothetical protein
LSLRVTGPDIREETQIEDPFHTTRIFVVLGWADLLKMLVGLKPRELEYCVKVVAGTVAIRRWFVGKDCCERCGTIIGGHPDLPGYCSRGEQVCESCYYSTPTCPPMLGQSSKGVA